MEKLHYTKKLWKWFVAFRNPKDIAEKHCSLLAIEILFVLCFFLTVKHAIRLGGRHFYLWLGTLFLGIVVESLSYVVPDVDSFWHAQSTVMLLGQRLPMHVIFLYPILLYTASVAISHLDLKSWAEPFAVGLAVVGLDFPFDVLGVKFLWWTWHDTDPNIKDRLYWVPWNNFYFFAAFSSSFILLFRGLWTLINGTDRFKSSGFLKKFVCSLLAAVLSIPCGVLLFTIDYHVLHDVFGVSTSLCVTFFLAKYSVIVWSAGKSTEPSFFKGNPWTHSQELVILVTLYFLELVAMVIFFQPENIQSLGFHEPIGDCNSSVPVHTPIGMVLQKRKYLCIDDFDEDYDFHCSSDPLRPWPSTTWYTICGTAFENHLEYIILIIASSFITYLIYFQMLMKVENASNISKHLGSKPKSN